MREAVWVTGFAEWLRRGGAFLLCWRDFFTLRRKKECPAGLREGVRVHGRYETVAVSDALERELGE
jgi:hypothetical protein